jgi:hypothetical protein
MVITDRAWLLLPGAVTRRTQQPTAVQAR